MHSTDKALIDTQIFLWMASEPHKLSGTARQVCESAELVLSVASVWEIAIKSENGRLSLSTPVREFIDRHVRAANVTILPIHLRHALRAAALPGAHKDPFDRMIAAQAMEEGLPCVSSDPALQALGAHRLW
jgi:PIN domain nuclease of toxin-antitoxin system